MAQCCMGAGIATTYCRVDKTKPFLSFLQFHRPKQEKSSYDTDKKLADIGSRGTSNDNNLSRQPAKTHCLPEIRELFHESDEESLIPTGEEVWGFGASAGGTSPTSHGIIHGCGTGTWGECTSTKKTATSSVGESTAVLPSRIPRERSPRQLRRGTVTRKLKTQSSFISLQSL